MSDKQVRLAGAAPLRNALHIMRLAGPDMDTLEQTRGMMERQVQQMVHLIDDLLDISRITRGKVELRKERVELAAVIQDALEACRPLIEAGGHELTMSLPPEPVSLDADPTRLAQVFSNLLNNAAKYTPRGGSIRLTAERREDEVVVKVRDTGIGIPADMLPRVFEMFTQVDRSLERSQGGLGIGLALLLTLQGSEVRTAYDGLEAIDAAAAFDPDVVLSDLGMPRMNGYEAAQKIRERCSGKVVLVAMTGWGQEEDKRRSSAAGFDFHLVKPVDLEALDQLLASLGPANERVEGSTHRVAVPNE